MEAQQKGRVVFLRGNKVTLRPLRKATDVEACLRWINDPDINRYLIMFLPVMQQAEEEWFDRLSKDEHNIALAIETLEGTLIGTMGLHQISWRDRIATTGALIGEKEYWGKGYGTDAKMTLLNFAFNSANLRKICSSVIAFNTRSLQYNLNCGYQIEGRRRKQFFRNGRYWDEILLAVFKKDWSPVWRKYQKTGSLK